MDGNLRLVILDRPTDLWGDPVAQDLFCRIVKLKLDGFGNEYPYGVLPLDTQDFISTHFAVCRELSGQVVPLMTYRQTTLSRSRLFNLPFPAISLVLAAKAPEHQRVVQEIIEQCEQGNRKLAYAGLWTIAPEVRQDRQLTSQLREIFQAVYTQFNQVHEITDVIAGGTMRFKLERVFGEWGFEPLSRGGTPLPPLSIAHLLGEQVVLMHQSRVPPASLALAEKWRHLWNDRLMLCPSEGIHDLPCPPERPPNLGKLG